MSLRLTARLEAGRSGHRSDRPVAQVL